MFNKPQKIQIPVIVSKQLDNWLHYNGWLELDVADNSKCEYKIYQHVNDNGSFYRLLTVSKQNKSSFNVINSLFSIYKFISKKHRDKLPELDCFDEALDSIENFVSFLDESVDIMLSNADRE